MIQQSPMVKVRVPVLLYDRLKRAAELTHRSVEDILATAVNAALPPDPNLPPELADDLAALAVFSDDALWAAAESSLSPAQQRRMEQLAALVDTRDLTPAESSELTQLTEQYDRSVLRRAKALSILAQRGYSIPNQAAFNGGNDDGSSHSSTAP